MENGQIRRFVEVVNGDGDWELAVEVFTDNGLVIGRLFAPTNAAEGVARFKPAPELQQYAGADATGDPLDTDTAGPSSSAGGGTLTTSAVPTTGGKREGAKKGDPNDPRGLRHGRR